MSIERIPPTQGSNGPSSSQEKQDPSKVMQDKVKEILQQLKVPSRQRGAWPVVAVGETLIWVYGARPRLVKLEAAGRWSRLWIEARKLEN